MAASGRDRPRRVGIFALHRTGNGHQHWSLSHLSTMTRMSKLSTEIESGERSEPKTDYA